MCFLMSESNEKSLFLKHISSALIFCITLLRAFLPTSTNFDSSEITFYKLYTICYDLVLKASNAFSMNRLSEFV